MEGTIKNSSDERILISKDNIIIEVNKYLLHITGYTESELIGKTLIEVSRLLRIDSQINLQDMENIHSLYIFTNEGLPINVTITYKISVKENIKIYYIKEIPQAYLRNVLLNFDDFSISDKQAFAIYSYPDFICLKTNKKYINSLNSINVNSDDPIGRPYQYSKYIPKVIEEGFFHGDEVEFIGSNGIATYWDMSMRLISGDENKTYMILSLYDVSNRVTEEKLHDKNRLEDKAMELKIKEANRINKLENILLNAQNELLVTVVEALDLEYIRCNYPDLKIISINGNGLNSLKEINNGIKFIGCPIGESYFSVYPIDEEVKRKELDLYITDKSDLFYVSYINHIIDKELRFFKTINQPILGLNNKIVEIVFITIDITDEVKEKNKIEETLEMQNQMFSTVSHELKTPLSVI